jgi:predicted nucleic acid-binding Zn ribbon protein
MTTCSDACSDELPIERPTLWASKAVRAATIAWLFLVLALLAGWCGLPRFRTGLFAAAIGSGCFYLRS